MDAHADEHETHADELILALDTYPDARMNCALSDTVSDSAPCPAGETDVIHMPQPFPCEEELGSIEAQRWLPRGLGTYIFRRRDFAYAFTIARFARGGARSGRSRG